MERMAAAQLAAQLESERLAALNSERLRTIEEARLAAGQADRDARARTAEEEVCHHTPTLVCTQLQFVCPISPLVRTLIYAGA
jgi:hypothetical protein